MHRRDLLAASGMALLMGGGRALAQAGAAPANEAKVVRIYATADGGLTWQALRR